MKKIILDTNFLLIPFQFKVDIFREIERICPPPLNLAVMDRTIEELKIISEKGEQKERMAAKVALTLLKKYPIETLKSKETDNADSAILSLASEHTIVATEDQELRRLLRAKGSSVIALRKKKFLILLPPTD